MSRDKVPYARGRKNDGKPEKLAMDIERVNQGVTVSWLAQAFGLNPVQVKERLRKCPPLQRLRAGYLYDFRTAAPYLVKPMFDVKEHIKAMRPEDLPTKLQEKYWSALMRRIKYEERAGMLWRTEKVLTVLGEVFQTIKFSLQLWADNLERATGITSEQRDCLRGMVDGLQDELYSRLKDLEKEGRTPHVLGEGLGTSDDDDDFEEVDSDLDEGDDEEVVFGKDLIG